MYRPTHQPETRWRGREDDFMGYPDVYQFNDKNSALEAANSCPLESTPMIDKQFNEVYCLTKPQQNVCFMAPDSLLLSQLYDSSVPDQPEPEICYPEPQVSRPDTKEQRGPFGVTINDQGEITSVTGESGLLFERQPDGKYVMKGQDGNILQTVENMKIDGLGNMQYDEVKDGKRVHVEFNVDGTYVLEDEEHGRIVYDKANNVLETPSGNGRVRKFQYENGQLVGIDGNLGHWDRVENNGQVSWKNRDTGAVWEGEFQFNSTTSALEYRGRSGARWAFTTDGQDIPLEPQK
jgi:hypothetical protein